MYRRFIAFVAAASVAITAFGAVPAYAGDRDMARALAAIVGIAVVGKIIHDKNKKKKERRVRHYDPYPQQYGQDRHRQKKHRHNGQGPKQKHYDKHHSPQQAHRPPRYRPQIEPRPLPRRVNRKLLPKNCFRNHQTRDGSVQMFSNRCLQRHYAYSQSLPRRCEYVFSTLQGDRRGYEARCLRDAGYRLARG